MLATLGEVAFRTGDLVEARAHAAEAATLWGGAFLWTRKTGWRPTFVKVDGQQVDYAWIDDTEEGINVTELAARAGA